MYNIWVDCTLYFVRLISGDAVITHCFISIICHKTQAMNKETGEYPRPRIPVHPILPVKLRWPFNNKSLCSVLDIQSIKFVTSGRAAIALALEDMQLNKDDKVLIPAYHCTSMVEPVIWSRATPVFYRIDADGSVNIKDIQEKLDGNVRAIIVTHYFGFPQDTLALRDLCDENGIFLIEDCAHALFGKSGGVTIGATGDYAIASMPKFFPTYDGGCIASSKNSLQGIRLDSSGFAFQIKSLFNIIERALEYGRLPLFRFLLRPLIYTKEIIWQKLKPGTLANKPLAPSSSEGSYQFEEEWIHKKISYPSKIIMKCTAKTCMAETRKGHFNNLLQAFSQTPGAAPLFDHLPEDVVPYVFPLLVNNPEPVFPVLKNKGVPIIRFGEYLWEGVDQSICQNSAYLSKHLFQLPCHQDLTIDEIAWMVKEIQETLQNYN